jgi:endonuclease/exonuclease/phosphatase family metal-dependent hydrolase
VPELTIASFNTHWGRGPRGLDYQAFEVVEACRRLDADVLVLQESWAPDDGPSDHARVAAALGMCVAAETSLARAVIDPKPKVTGRAASRSGDGSWVLALLTGSEVRSAEVIPLPHLWPDPVDRAVLAVEVAVDGSPLHLRATHLPHLEMGVHLSTMALRRTLPDPSVAAALIGDMNMWGWSIDAMVPRGWRRVVKGKTFPAHRPHSQIDHLLVTRSVEAVDSAVGPDLGSDHLPIRARLRWS